jgi:hypothetical protein
LRVGPYIIARRYTYSRLGAQPASAVPKGDAQVLDANPDRDLAQAELRKALGVLLPVSRAAVL